MYMRTGSVRAADFGVDRREHGDGFLGARFRHRLRPGVSEQQRLAIGRNFVHLDAHAVDHADDVFDLLRIDDVVGQVIVDLGVGQVALFHALDDQGLDFGLLLLVAGFCSHGLSCFKQRLGSIGGVSSRYPRLARCGDVRRRGLRDTDVARHRTRPAGGPRFDAGAAFRGLERKSTRLQPERHRSVVDQVNHHMGAEAADFHWFVRVFCQFDQAPKPAFAFLRRRRGREARPHSLAGVSLPA